jgi:hypothetical protein
MASEDSGTRDVVRVSSTWTAVVSSAFDKEGDQFWSRNKTAKRPPQGRLLAAVMRARKARSGVRSFVGTEVIASSIQ